MDFTRQYLDIVKAHYCGLNLTRIQGPEEFYLKHYLDSLLPWQKIPPFRERLLRASRVVDVGTGGGFPLLPLAFHIPERMFHGLEARRKKAQAVSSIAEMMGMDNVCVTHGRLEETAFEEGFVLLFRALGRVADCLKKVESKGRGTCFFYKGPSYCPGKELEGLGPWRLILTERMILPGQRGRVLVGLERGWP